MSRKADKTAEEKIVPLQLCLLFYPILVLVFVFVRQIDKDKHTGTHKQGLRRRTWSSPCAHSYVDFSPAAKQGGELHPCQSLQAVGRWSVRWVGQ